MRWQLIFFLVVVGDFNVYEMMLMTCATMLEYLVFWVVYDGVFSQQILLQ